MADLQPRDQGPYRLTRLSRPGLLLLALSGLTALGTAPCLAGSVTAESILDQRNALQRAQSQLPAGSTVTRTKCSVVNVGIGNDRYICTLFFTDPPIDAAPTPRTPSAPAP